MKIKEFDYKGFNCFIKKFSMGPLSRFYLGLGGFASNTIEWLCGYVALPQGHPLHGKEYDEIDDKINDVAHFGLTYSNLEGNDWVIGFDCNHAFDTPATNTVQFVEGNIEEIVDTILEIYPKGE
jgi:hypothetical protein